MREGRPGDIVTNLQMEGGWVILAGERVEAGNIIANLQMA